MCGRARCTLGSQQVAQACGFQGNVRSVDSERHRPSYNVAPGSYMPILRYESKSNSKEPIVHCMKWGLVPSFTKKGTKPDHYRMFNARSESFQQKASFNRLLSKGRCLATVEGFYEWKKDGAKKQPYYLHFKDDHPLVFAALYDCWEGFEGELLYSFTILTTRCSQSLEWLHDRMPVILGNAESIDAWINQDLSELEFPKLLRPYEGHDLVWYPVTPAMGKPSFDGPECTEELKPKLSSKTIMSQLFSKVKSEKPGIESSPKTKDSSEILSNAGFSEAVLNEEEKLALAAGMEPDEGKPNEMLLYPNDKDQQFDERDGKVNHPPKKNPPWKENPADICNKATYQDTKEDKLWSETKKRKIGDSVKSPKTIHLSRDDHQKSLLTFFHKQ